MSRALVAKARDTASELLRQCIPGMVPSDPNLVAQQAYTSAPAPQSNGAVVPELSSGLVAFYIVSFFCTASGIAFLLVYRNKVNEQDKAAARLFLILGIVSFVISCMCSFVFPVMLSLGSY
ncbi:MAG: hypothetical protein H6643_10965 [Caldilineaceae bacterium]|nr:hypothetical protein [Caldilineaceae bacterium]